jgi:quercetin dioxygenase-like cupin family protein
MRMRRLVMVIVAALAAAGLGALAAPPGSPGRTVLGQADLSAPDGMEVIASVMELKSGESLPRHLHHGIESGYVLQGSTVQFPGKAPTVLATGTSIMTLRDVPHAGFTVLGPQSLKLYTVHVVDKGKPLYEWLDQPQAEH